MKIVLLVRSYNRPDYLENTLKSLLNSDIQLCSARYIYDDGSNDEQITPILTNTNYINIETKEFDVIRNTENVGCRQSFINAMNYIKANEDCDYICNVDNDVVVKPNFIQILLENYEKASTQYNTRNLILTGFNPVNAHNNCIEEHDTYYRKRSIGGINYFFHIEFLDFIIECWKKNSDWEVVHEMGRKNMPICCTKQSVLNHTGRIGISSGTELHYTYDNDDERFNL